MARTVDEIYADLLARKESYDELRSLDSTSRTAIWRLWLYLVAYASYMLESIFDKHKADVEKIASEAVVGTNRWLVATAKRYQDGDQLLVDEYYRPYYSQDDSAKRIVTQAAASTVAGITTLKVARGIPGSLQPLTPEQLTRFRAYIADWQLAGTHVEVVSKNADMMQVDVNVYYDGKVDVDELRALCTTAIRGYLSGISFNSVFLLNHLRNAIEAVPGVYDVDVRSVQASRAGEFNWQTVSRSYNSDAGHISIEDEHLALSLIAQ